ncbi:MAG TPA: hypothetical protein VNE38_15005 [Ktedonobacteraceae bacterium]|nr:hypothetical protein [Ktedonobacteraceae bacterium]
MPAPASNNHEAVGQIVDTPSALEFMREALEKITEEELTSIVAELRSKSQRVQQMFAPNALPAFDENKFRALLRSVFSTRRRAADVMALVDADLFRNAVNRLLHDSAPLAERFDLFVAQLEPLDLATRCDLAGECLHYWDFERYWLWTRWMWDPAHNTGSLPLVTIQEYDLHGETPGLTYLKVGEAMAFVNGVGEAAGFQHGGRGLLGTDVYLSCVYVVYLYTVTRMRMTKEFNQVIPQFPELARRLLGTYKMEV